MDKLLFIYDKLMTADEQSLINVPLRLVSFAQMQARMYQVNDTKKKRLLAFPKPGVSTKVVYGGLFLLRDFEFHQHKLHSYYYSCTPFTGIEAVEDMFVMKDVTVRPIRFQNLASLAASNYEVGECVSCAAFVGNARNKKIQNSLKKKYWTAKNIDKGSFIKMVKESQGEK